MTLNFVENLLYREVPRYAERLERLYAMFPPDQVLVLRFNDLTADEDRVFQRVLAFLDLKPLVLEHHRPHNQADGLATIGIRRFLAHHPRLYAALRSVLPQPLISSACRLVERVRSGTSARPPSRHPRHAVCDLRVRGARSRTADRLRPPRALVPNRARRGLTRV